MIIPLTTCVRDLSLLLVFRGSDRNLLIGVDVHALATDPDHQRRGAGAALLEQVNAIADREGWPIYLTSTETGRKLYERSGFQAIREVVIDLEAMGEVKKGRETFTVRFASVPVHARLIRYSI